MFNIYLYNILFLWKKSGIGCHMNGMYMAALGYANDITLTWPSLYGLICMFDRDM